MGVLRTIIKCSFTLKWITFTSGIFPLSTKIYQKITQAAVLTGRELH